MAQAQRAWVAEAGRIERALVALADRRARMLERCIPFLRDRRNRLLARRWIRLILWTLTLRLPGEIGYWLRARRLRGADGLFARRRLFVARSARPTVSVVIPTCGKAAMTLRCLGSIAANPPAASIEVIVVDDASGDPGLRRLRRVRGLRIVSTPKTLGFIGAANLGAQAARGEMLMFLNNDTLVRPNWLDPLVETLRRHPRTGAAGAKLVYPDGSLQEAGGIVWRDATACNFGRHDDPARPEYNYLRAVDYCSAAALLVRRELFEQLGGFDPLFAPAYYEDADLAFRLREQGYATLYQPLAEIVHLESASHGARAKLLIDANRERFLARWAKVLERENSPADASPLRARDRDARRKMVLMVDHRPPEPDRDGGSYNVAAAIAALREAGIAVTLWVEAIRDPEYVAALQSEGVEVRHGDLDAFAGFLRKAGSAIDLVILNRPEVAAAHLGPVRRSTSARVIYNGLDLHGARIRMQAAVDRRAETEAEAGRLERLERWIWRSADRSLYLSDEEVAAVAALEPAAAATAIVPFAFASFAEPRGAPPGREMLFVGGFAHSPNADAVLWFASEILPAVLQVVPDARLVVAGSEMPRSVLDLAGEHVAVLPDVPASELRALYARARLAIAPLRFGAGVKLKVVEALREGVPLVTTGVGAQGLPGLGDIVPVANDAAGFAKACCALLSDDGLWRRTCGAQIAYAAARFSRKRFTDALLVALELRRPARAAKRPRRGAGKPATAGKQIPRLPTRRTRKKAASAREPELEAVG